MLLVCCSLLNSQNISINNSEKRLVTYLLGHHQQQKGAIGGAITGATTGKRSNKWPMDSFIHNGSDITTWMGYSFKIKSTIQNPNQSNIFKIRTFLNLKLQINRLTQGHWSCTSTH